MSYETELRKLLLLDYGVKGMKWKNHTYAKEDGEKNTQVLGEKGLQDYIEKKMTPEIKEDSKKYSKVLSSFKAKITPKVKETISKIFGEDGGATFDISILDKNLDGMSDKDWIEASKEFKSSTFCVSFWQNKTEKNITGYYNDDNLADMIAISKKELNTNKVQLGIYQGSAEISLSCNSFYSAVRFASIQNQDSIFNTKSFKVIMMGETRRPKTLSRNKEYNKIKGD